MAKMKLVKVSWVDATVRSGWHHWEDKETLEPVMVDTVGWVVDSNKRFVTLTQTVCSIAAGNLTTIPRGWIKRMKRLK